MLYTSSRNKSEGEQSSFEQKGLRHGIIKKHSSDIARRYFFYGPLFRDRNPTPGSVALLPKTDVEQHIQAPFQAAHAPTNIFLGEAKS